MIFNQETKRWKLDSSDILNYLGRSISEYIKCGRGANPEVVAEFKLNEISDIIYDEIEKCQESEILIDKFNKNEDDVRKCMLLEFVYLDMVGDNVFTEVMNGKSDCSPKVLDFMKSKLYVYRGKFVKDIPGGPNELI